MNEPLGGPPPDPSTRAWRHPSEIAAAAAATARDEASQAAVLRPALGRRRFSPFSFAIGGATGAAVSLGVVALLSSNAVAPGFAASPSIDLDVPVEPLTSVVATAVVVTPTSPPLDTAQTSSTQSPAIVTPPSGLVRPSSGLVTEGVLSVVDDDDTVVASAVVVDDLLLTSATATRTHRSLWVVVDGEPVEIIAAGTDRFTDVAVYRLGGDAPPLLPSAPLVDDARPTPGDPVAVVGDETPPDDASLGEVIAVDERVMTSDGHTVIGAVLSSVRRPEHGAGSAMVDMDGDVVGIVVASDGILAASIPIGVAIDVARGLTERGWPRAAWLGLEAIGTDDGVELTLVEADGPADRAGLRPGDLLQRLDNESIDTMADLVEELRTLTDGDAVDVVVSRDGADVQAEVVVASK